MQRVAVLLPCYNESVAIADVVLQFADDAMRIDQRAVDVKRKRGGHEPEPSDEFSM